MSRRRLPSGPLSPERTSADASGDSTKGKRRHPTAATWSRWATKVPMPSRGTQPTNKEGGRLLSATWSLTPGTSRFETIAHSDRDDRQGAALIHELGHCLGIDHPAISPTVVATLPWSKSSMWSEDPRMSYGVHRGEALLPDDRTPACRPLCRHIHGVSRGGVGKSRRKGGRCRAAGLERTRGHEGRTEESMTAPARRRWHTP